VQLAGKGSEAARHLRAGPDLHIDRIKETRDFRLGDVVRAGDGGAEILGIFVNLAEPAE